MNEKPNIFIRLFKKIWTVLNFSRKVIFNVIALMIIVIMFSAIFSNDGKVILPESSALVLNLKGDLVEQKRFIDPTDAFMSEMMGSSNDAPEVDINELLMVINKAKTDKQINAIVLQLSQLRSAGFSKLQTVGKALTNFKESGKKIYAIGDGYSQSHYYLASYADEIILNPMGWVSIEGFARNGTYFKDALEKFKVTPHIFRVGTYKSAVEPFIRNDMSEPAKEANKLWLDELWQFYATDVAAQRKLTPEDINQSLDTFLEKFEAANGNMAQVTLENGWVDLLKDREETRQYLMTQLGKNKSGKSYSGTSYRDYLSLVAVPPEFQNPLSEKIAVVVAKGTIQNGSKQAGEIGGDSTAKLLRQARLNDKVKAVVLRIDSPGGSAFASEVIRTEIDALQAAGKPVVASMSSVAASGGYWIAASANEIWASPTTITGSIGVFGMFMTLEKAFDHVGIHVDGVSTNEMSDFSIAKPLNPKIGQMIQRSIEHSYKQFVTLVSDNRNMTLEQADSVAQGRVWTGNKALELGLVDQLGDLSQAVDSAAKLAGLKHFDTWFVEKELSQKERFMKELFNNAQMLIGSSIDEDSALHNNSIVSQFMQFVRSNDKFMKQLNDPNNVYALCEGCELN